MRFKQIIEEAILTELKMSPSFLQKLAANVEGAMAGMEFEMIVPGGYGTDTDDAEWEADYDKDERAESIEDVIAFFSDDPDGMNPNSSNDIQRLQSALEQELFEWSDDDVNVQWENEGREILSDYLRNNEWDQDTAVEAALDELGVDHSALESVTIKAQVAEITKAKFEEFVDEEWESQGRAYDEALDEFRSDHEIDEREFFRENYRDMTDVERSFNISWPYYISTNDPQDSLESLASEFSDMIGRNVKAGESYHGVTRDSKSYVLEPDSSLDADDDGESGLEFVSPPLPVAELISDLKKVMAWANSYGCYTNESCGLHMNVSVPGMSGETLDYVKMALFLGDEYILGQFGRQSNTYCKSALQKIRAKAANNPALAVMAMDKLKEHMQTIASRLIHDNSTDKYTSINVKEGGRYVEIRSPGGDWLNEDISKLTATLNRIVVALDAANNPDKYKDEYAKKFYKLISSQPNSTVELFVKYTNGQMTRDELKLAWANNILNAPGMKKSAVNTIPLANKIVKTSTAKSWWNVGFINPNTQSVTRQEEFVAASGSEAIGHARTKWGLPSAKYPDSMFRTERTKTYIAPAAQKVQDIANSDEFGQMFDNTQWDINDAHGNLIHTLVGPTNQGEANRAAAAWLPRNGHQAGQEFEIVPHRNRPAPQERWARWNVRFNDGRQMPVSARNHHEAEQEAIRQSNRSQDDIASIVLDTV